MATNLTTNPFFDPNPSWMFTILKIQFVIFIPIAILTCYLIIFKSPSYQSESFKYLVLFNFVISTLFHADFCGLSPPLVLLPYVSMRFNGLLTLVGISTFTQLILLATIICAATTSIVPLFYYRMNVLLKKSHPLNHIWIRVCVYSALYFIDCVLPPVLFIGAWNYKDQESAKNQAFKSHQIVIEDFWTEQVFVFDLDDNPWLTCAFVMGIAMIIIITLIVFGCTYTIIYLLNDQARKLSIKSKTDHKAIFKSLVRLMIAIAFFWGMGIAAIVVLFYWVGP